MPPTKVPVPIAVRQPPAGRALSSMAAALGRGLGRIDTALLRVLDASYAASSRDAARLEATLLLRLRRGLVPYTQEARQASGAAERIDNVLADGLLESVDAALAVVADLEGEPQARYGRWLSFCHELVSELVALKEGELDAAKRSLEGFGQRLRAPNAPLAALSRELGSFFVELARRLEHNSPLRAPTLLDEVLRGAAPPATTKAP